MNSEPQISVIIPVYNSAPTLIRLNKQLHKTLITLANSYEVIYVNDGSTDQSWQVLKKIYQTSPHTTVINLTKNFGQHNALFCGFTQARGEFVITIDDDLQFPPQEINKLVDTMLTQPDLDVVIGIPKTSQAPLIKNLGSKLCYLITKLRMKNITKLRAGAFRIIRKSIVNKLLEYKYRDPIVGMLLFMLTKKIINIEVSHQLRTQGKSGYQSLKTLKHFLNFMTVGASTPKKTLIRILITSSITTLLLYLLFELPLIFNKFLLISGLEVFILTLQIISISLLLNYLLRLTHQLKRSSQYCINNILKHNDFSMSIKNL